MDVGPFLSILGRITCRKSARRKESEMCCNKLHRLTNRTGSDTADALCGGPIGPDLKPSGNNALTYTTYATTSDTTTLHTTTSRTRTGTSKDGAEEPGGWSSVYVVAAIICVISLLIAFLLSWKQKICSLKLWKKKIYIVNPDTVVVASIAEVSTCRRSVMTDCDSRESLALVSRYPEQESSKLSANDLTISIEEEERELCAAKAILV